jgi:acetylornithine deacetylase
MTIEPWTPVVRDGRLFGRGSCDIKGGMAAMLAALARLAEERPQGMPTIVMACTVNEEHGFTGATALSKLWGQGSSIFPRKPDAAVVAEPTSLNVVVAHKGVVRWRCRTHGRAGHSSQPHLADNAIYKMAPVLAALEHYQREIAPGCGSHPRCGSPTLSVGTISGGLSVNTVPASCTIEIDRRVLPGEDPKAARDHVVGYLNSDSRTHAGVEHEPPLMVALGLSDVHNGPLGDRLLAAARGALGRGEKIGVPFGTDAGVYSAAGVPSVVFGPGSIDQAHTADEWLPLDELEKASEVLYQFGRAKR